MPATQPRQIIDAILDAIAQGGLAGILISGIRHHPRRFSVTAVDGTQILLSVYAWTLTPGGRPQLANEYRIQMTSVESPLPISSEGPTVLLGYEPNLKMFAGFDLTRHRTFTTGSPSVQVDIRTIRRALQDGLAFDRKTNNEIAVGVRPDQLITYAVNSERLHRYGRETSILRMLTRASSLETIAHAEIAALPSERRRIVQTISRLSREANFRQQVLHAYGNRCAVTRTQLRLVDAAHILPVGAPGSLDDVRNGVALAPTYHRAYDAGLIFLDEQLRMRINVRKEAELIALRLDGGLDRFRAQLGRIHLPPDRQQWPDPGLIARANRFRIIST